MTARYAAAKWFGGFDADKSVASVSKYRLTRCRGDARATVPAAEFPAVRHTARRPGDLPDEIPEISNGPPSFRQYVGRQREVVNLAVP